MVDADQGFRAAGGPASATVSGAALDIDGVSLGYSELSVLRGVSMKVGAGKAMALVGPAGVGKSSLLRAIGRYGEQRPGYWVRGVIRVDGVDVQQTAAEPLQRQVAMLAQKARLYTATVLDNAIAGLADGPMSFSEKRALAERVLAGEGLWQELGPLVDRPVASLSIAQQRMLTLSRLCYQGARCLLADEPLRDVQPADVDRLLGFLCGLVPRHTLVVVTHNQQVAKALADRVCLVAAGQLVEEAAMVDFFERPSTELAKQFVRTGNCWPDGSAGESGPAPRAASASLSTAVGQPPRATAPRVGGPQSGLRRAQSLGQGTLPGGFAWVSPGLAGLQRPGLLRPETEDLQGLQDLKVQHLVSLTEQPFPAERLREFGIVGHHLPIPDMGAPDPLAARACCMAIERMLASGMRVALHCKAGLGRTGTMLAAVLVCRGRTAESAIAAVRAVNPLYIQSQCQLEFLFELGALVASDSSGLGAAHLDSFADKGAEQGGHHSEK